MNWTSIQNKRARDPRIPAEIFLEDVMKRRNYTPETLQKVDDFLHEHAVEYHKRRTEGRKTPTRY